DLERAFGDSDAARWSDLGYHTIADDNSLVAEHSIAVHRYHVYADECRDLSDRRNTQRCEQCRNAKKPGHFTLRAAYSPIKMCSYLPAPFFTKTIGPRSQLNSVSPARSSSNSFPSVFTISLPPFSLNSHACGACSYLPTKLASGVEIPCG